MEATQSAQAPPLETKEGRADLDPKAFTLMKVNSYRENIKALGSVKFRRSAGAQDQHIDLGCGPGSFLQDELLPRVRPCRRIVGSDSSQDMLHFARSNCRQPEVLFELLDIEQGDAQALVDKYGQFDRVYSFLTFHYVRDTEKAYRNVHKLLKDGGECMVVYFTKTGIQDVWHQICESEEWKDFVPDLREMFPDRSKSGEPMTQQQHMVHERETLASAELEVVDCRTYTSQWVFPTAESCLSAAVPFFKLDAKVPEEKRTAFWEACKSALLQVSTMTPEGMNLPFDVIVTHAQKPVVFL